MSALPWWLAVTVAVAMLGVAGCCAYRLATLGRRHGGRVNDSCHLLMGIAMAGMAVGALATLPATWWLVIFAGYGLWFAGRLVRALRRQPGRQALAGTFPHLLMSGAMVYMVAAMPTMPDMPGMSSMATSDLLCGAWMLGMHGTTVVPPVPLPALGLGVLCFADAALATRHVLRQPSSATETGSLMAEGAVTSAPGVALATPAELAAPAGPSAAADAADAAELSADGAVALLAPTKALTTWSINSAAACHVVMALAMGLMLVTMR